MKYIIIRCNVSHGRIMQSASYTTEMNFAAHEAFLALKWFKRWHFHESMTSKFAHINFLSLVKF